MQRLPKRLIRGSQLTTTAVAYYTTQANVTTTISACTVTNTGAAVITVTMYLVPATLAPSASNAVLAGRSLAVGESYNVAGAIGQTLEAGGAIYASASSATSITLVASGYEQT